MNVLLCGYHWIGCRVLDLLLDSGHSVFVCTHLAPPHVPSLAAHAETRGVDFTLESVNEAQIPFTPDILCSIYYRERVCHQILKHVRYRAFNLHPSLLPEYRGCSSLAWAMVNGEKEVGFTYHYMREEFDVGPIVLQKSIPTFEFEKQSNLYQRVMFAAADHFLEAFRLVDEGFAGIEQAEGGRYYKRGAPESGEISSSWPDEKIKRFIRAMVHPPLPYATFRGREIPSFEKYLRVLNEDRD